MAFWELRFQEVCIGSANRYWGFVSCLPLATGTCGCPPNSTDLGKVRVSRLSSGWALAQAACQWTKAVLSPSY